MSSTTTNTPAAGETDVVVRYRLPVTTIKIAGTRTHVVNRKSVPTIDTVSRNATAVTQIDADPRLWLSFTDPGPLARRMRSDVERDLAFTTKPDGRLQTINAKVTDTSAERLKASLQIGASVSGALGSLLIPAGPLGVAVGVAAGVVTGAVAYSAHALGIIRLEPGALDAAFDDAAGEELSRPTLDKLGIPPAYAAEQKAAAELLANLKWSEIQLLDAIGRATTTSALAAPRDLSAQLRHLQRSLVAVREALVESERACLAWVADQAEVTNTMFNEVLTIDELPTTPELHRIVSSHFPANDRRRCVGLFEDLRFAVTCDLLDPDVDQNRTVRPDVKLTSDTAIWFRRPRIATVTHWEITKSGTGLLAKPTLVERKVVVLPGDEEQLEVVARTGSGTASATFDADGLLIGESVHVKDPSVDTIKALAEAPSLIKDGLASGAAVVDGLTTSDAEKTARAKDALDLLKAEKDLTAARGPAAPDRLKQMRDDLEEAELRARLAKARLIISDPTTSVVEICSVTPSAPTT